MATAAGDADGQLVMDNEGQKEEIQKERFHIRFQYLKSEKTVEKCFVDKLPSHIKPIDRSKIWKGFDTAYGEYIVTFEQNFQTTRVTCIEEDVYNTWFSSKPSTEEMAWLEILRKKRSYPESAKSKQEYYFLSDLVIGGSMTSPVTFVRHWQLNNSKNFEFISCRFQFETSKLKIEKCVLSGEDPSFVLEISYDSLHETIFAEKSDENVIILLTLKSGPKIYNTGNNSKRLVAKDTGFHDIGRLNSYYIKFDTQIHRYEVEQLLSSLICTGFRVAYIELQTKTPELEGDVLLPDIFELEYAWQCVTTIGFKVTDHLTFEVKKYIEDLSCKETQLMAKVFCNLAVELIEKPFFHFKNELDLIKKRTQTTIDHDLPPHYSMVARMVLTPARSLFLPKEPMFQNRIVRKYGEDYFIRVVFRDEDFEKISTVQSDAVENILERMKTFFKGGFQIQTRHYEFLGCSNSQLREHSFWFFHPHDDITSEKIRNSSGELSTERCVASYVSRFGLCFSSTKKTVDVDKSCVQYTDDIQNDEYCFTDGIGRLSTKLAEKVANELNICPVPSAFQIRFGGCKGVVAQDPTLGNDADVLVIRKSMHKFKSDSNNLEILEVTRPGRLHLNRQVITLLSGLGIPDHVFLNLQEKVLIDLADMLLYDELALPTLLESAVSIDFSLIATKGISFVQEPFFRSLLKAIYHHRITNLMKRTRIQIPLDKGRIMMGTTDETKTLQSGQVFIRYSQQTTYPGKNAITYEGPVVVTKNPCFHEGDVRVFIATNVPELSHMIDCIVFPQKGIRPHPDEMSGSDLDGDMYFVCWDQNLCKFQNRKPMDFPKAEKKQLNRKVNSHDVIDFLADYIRYDKLGLIANAHLVHADNNENGIFSDECHRLAEMHSDAVDFPKTGKIPKIDDDLRPKCYPDFMMKRDKQIYPSTKIIGKLYRQCRPLSRIKKQPGLKNELGIDKDLILQDINAKTLDDAKLQRDQYTSKIVEVLDMYGISNECEAITGLVQSVKSVKGCLKDEKFQVGQIVKDKICLIQKKTREIFFDEFGGESNAMKKDKDVLEKASAWYKVTYMNEKETYREVRSFPWIVADILVLLKRRCNSESRINRFEVYLAEYYRLSQTNRENRDKLLNIIYTNVKTLLRNILTNDDELIIIGLEFCGLLKNQHNLNVATNGLKLQMITESLKEQGINKSKKTNQDPCYCVTSKENVFARFVSDARMIKLSKVMKNYLSEKLTNFKPAVQFLLDVLQDVFPTDSDRYVFSDLIAIMIIFLTRLNNPDDNNCANCLFGIVNNYVLGFRSWNLSEYEVLKDGFEALGMTETVMSEISDKFLTVYHKTAQNFDTNPFLETGKSFGISQSHQSYEDDDELHGTFSLSLNIWNEIKYSEKHFEVQLSKLTGADVFLNKTQTGPNRIDAYGSEAALSRVDEITSNFSKTQGNLKFYAENGHCIVDKAYSIIFQGGSEESILFFEKYHEIHHGTHFPEKIFVPKLMNIREDNSYGDFETKFVKQWHVIKSEYNAIVHGNLFLSISFGILYVMNIKRNSMLSVLELNNQFSTLDLRKKQAKKTMKRHRKTMRQAIVPYTFSFEPIVLSDCGEIRKVLECIGLSYDNGGLKKISLRFGYPFYYTQEYDEDGGLLCVKLSDMKWLMASVVPYVLQNTNIRYKLQTNRDLEGKYVNKINKISLKTATNGYQLAQLPYICNIHYAREKNIESYSLTNWFGGYKLKIEVATITDLNYRQKTGMLVRTSAPRIEIRVLPEIPNISSSEEDLKSYARHIWQWTLKLAAELEKM